jgi:hypothetical protein
MQIWSIIFSIILTSMLPIAPAKAYSPKEGNVNAAVGPFVYRTRYDGSNTSVKSPLFGDLGLIVNGDISDKGAIEIAMFHMQKLFVREASENYLAEATELIHITMGYRRWLNSYFSLSWAFFSSYAIGDPRTVHSDFSASNGIDTSARDSTEYGLDFSLQTEIWNKERYSVIIDTRYSRSVTAKPNERADHYGAMLALRYFVQEKQIRDQPN